MDTYLAEARLEDARVTLDRHVSVDHSYVIPHAGAQRIFDEMDAAAGRAHERLEAQLRLGPDTL